ncbi:MAG: M1 family metallopeptidase [Bacteroidota bacterium]
MKNTFLLIILYILFSGIAGAQITTQDIEHYTFNIKLNDDNDSIYVISEIKGKTLNKEAVLNLDKGMMIEKVIAEDKTIPYRRVRDSLFVSLNNKNFAFNIYYKGIPKDGLIIGENKFGNRTFFGDNWPDRAKNWLSVYDHPSDKACVEYFVEVPSKYSVVANGTQLTNNIKDSTTVFHYKTSYELSTKLMVIGVAEFATQTVQESPFVIKSYVYPDNKSKAFYDYSIAPEITSFFEELIGKYPFDKLYNVQSTTRYGGMENAGCVFYDENSIDGNRTNEYLLAHEIAHQWFGNSVSEKDWPHLWLSEGFATYLENVYMEYKYGKEKMAALMVSERRRVLNYKNKFPYRVLVPAKVDDPNIMLNPYSYQKGAWLLHMLRSEVGDDTFFEILGAFYQKFKYSNANTDDFIKVAESVSKKDLKRFFNPWLYSYELPEYEGEWEYSNGKVIGKIKQIQKEAVFTNTMVVLLKYDNGKSTTERIEINSKTVDFEIISDKKPVDVFFDPNNLILKE